jgi:hypothetical protein
MPGAPISARRDSTSAVISPRAERASIMRGRRTVARSPRRLAFRLAGRFLALRGRFYAEPKKSVVQ